MTPFEPLRQELREASEGLDYWGSRYALFGSSVMYLYGIREEIGDIDIFVDYELWNRLLERGWEKQVPREEDPPLLEGRLEGLPPVHAFYAWKDRGMQIDIEALLDTDRRQQDWPVQPLEELRAWKASIMHHDTRPNDISDIIKINEFIDSGNYWITTAKSFRR